MATTSSAPNKMKWAGRVVSGLVVLFLVVDGAMKLAKVEVVVEATTKLGIPESQIVGLGVLLLSCVTVYAIPRTSVLGAILLTGYLGGAVATHVRDNKEVFPVSFSVGVGVLAWLGLWLRCGRLRAIVPWRI
jgi:hypothetical protein